MADYVSIQNENLEPGAPWISSTAFALRDNPIAIAEGAPGAPRLQLIDILAREDLTAGSVTRYLNPNASETANTSNYQTVLDIVITQQGTVRISCDHRRPGVVENAIIRFVLNNSTLQSWSRTSTSYVTRELDVAVTWGDRIRVQHISSGGTQGTSQVRNRAIKTGGENIYPIAADISEYRFFLVS